MEVVYFKSIETGADLCGPNGTEVRFGRRWEVGIPLAATPGPSNGISPINFSRYCCIRARVFNERVGPPTSTNNRRQSPGSMLSPGSHPIAVSRTVWAARLPTTKEKLRVTSTRTICSHHYEPEIANQLTNPKTGSIRNWKGEQEGESEEKLASE